MEIAALDREIRYQIDICNFIEKDIAILSEEQKLLAQQLDRMRELVGDCRATLNEQASRKKQCEHELYQLKAQVGKLYQLDKNVGGRGYYTARDGNNMLDAAVAKYCNSSNQQLDIEYLGVWGWYRVGMWYVYIAGRDNQLYVRCGPTWMPISGLTRFYEANGNIWWTQPK